MAIAKSESTIVDVWAAVTAAAMRQGAEIDLSAVYTNVIGIAVARIEAVDHANGALITVEGKISEVHAWRILTTFRSSAGTVATIDVDAQSSSTTLPVSATANFETFNDKYFVKDGTDIADSEIVRNEGFDSNVSITTMENMTHTHENTSDVYTGVDEFTLVLPPGLSTARVLIWNDDADCDIATRTGLAKQTGI